MATILHSGQSPRTQYLVPHVASCAPPAKKNSALPGLPGRALSLSQQLPRQVNNAENQLNHHQGGYCFRCRRFVLHFVKMPPYGLMPQLRHAHYNTLCVYCQAKTLHTLKKTNKKNSRASFHPRGRCLTKCKGTTPCALILPITLTLSSIFFHTFAPLTRLQLNMGHRSAQLLYSWYVNMAGTTRDMAEKWWQILPD